MHISVNDTKLYFDVEGASLIPDGPSMRERPTVLLLHGGPGFDHAYFKPYLSALSDSAQLVYLDQRGQGRSDRPPLNSCTIEQMADDAAAFCQALHITRPAILGHSFGGFVALQLTVRHPELVGQLILVDTAASTDDMAGSMTMLEQRCGAAARAVAERLFSGDTSQATLIDFDRLVMPAYVRDPANVGLFAEAIGRTILNPDLMANYFGRNAAGYDLRPHLGTLRVPTLVIVGDDDWLLPPSASRLIANSIPEAELVVVPNAGHMPFIEQPAVFSAAVQQFLAAAPPVGVGGI
jgi:proline iminopeptidase